MKLENQVTNLELSKCLEKLGVKQESLFWWTQEETPTNSNMHEYGYLQKDMRWLCMYGQRSRLSGSRIYQEYSAFTVAELGEMLPKGYMSMRCDKGYLCGNSDFTDDRGFIPDPATLGLFETEANARAEMVAYLKENNLLTL